MLSSKLILGLPRYRLLNDSLTTYFLTKWQWQFPQKAQRTFVTKTSGQSTYSQDNETNSPSSLDSSDYGIDCPCSWSQSCADVVRHYSLLTHFGYEDNLQPEQVWNTGGYIGMYRKCECSLKWKKTVENDLKTGVMDDLKPYGSFHWTLCLSFLLRVRCLHGLWQEKLPALEAQLQILDHEPLVRGTCPMCQQPTCNWLLNCSRVCRLVGLT